VGRAREERGKRVGRYSGFIAFVNVKEVSSLFMLSTFKLFFFTRQKLTSTEIIVNNTTCKQY
jgi:hypothetical protein